MSESGGASGQHEQGESRIGAGEASGRDARSREATKECQHIGCWDICASAGTTIIGRRDGTATTGSNRCAGGDGGIDNKGAKRGVEASDGLFGASRVDAKPSTSMVSPGREDCPKTRPISTV